MRARLFVSTFRVQLKASAALSLLPTLSYLLAQFHTYTYATPIYIDGGQLPALCCLFFVFLFDYCALSGYHNAISLAHKLSLGVQLLRTRSRMYIHTHTRSDTPFRVVCFICVGLFWLLLSDDDGDSDGNFYFSLAAQNRETNRSRSKLVLHWV